MRSKMCMTPVFHLTHNQNMLLYFAVFNLVALLLEVYLPSKTSKKLEGSDAKFGVENSPQGRL